MINEFVKHKLDQIGPGFCLAKWATSTMHLGLGKTHSCHHCGPHIIPLEELKKDVSALHNTSFKKKQRQIMLAGGRPEECDYCWKIEDHSDYYSDRIVTSAKSENLIHFEEIKHTDHFDPTYLEVSFSNVCNLKCAYCGPSFSSQWYNEILVKGPYPTSSQYNSFLEKQVKEEINPYILAFWEYLPKIYNNLHTFRITGGEPLLSKNTFKILEYIKNNPNPNLTLTVNSNLSVDTEILNKFILACKDIPVRRIDIATSNESYKEKAEYVRDGLNYEAWLSSCENILKSIKNVRLHLMCAYNVLSVSSFTNFLKDVKNLKDKYQSVELSVSYVRHPKFLEASILPVSWRHYLEDSLLYLEKNFHNDETISRFKHCIAWFDEKENNSITKKDFALFIKEYDLRRSKRFLDVFPEYSNILHEYSKGL
jgi:organic radical activating enzyme